MRDLNDKVTGNSLTAPEWGDMPSELQNIIENLGIVLSAGDLNQVGKAIAGYVANGSFYTDSGAANAHVLTAIGLKQSPPAYADGFKATFRAAATNTGPTTINVATIGVANIFFNGAALTGGEILINTDITVRYDLSNTRFDLIKIGPSSTFSNNSSGNPNISDLTFAVTAFIAEDTWESVGPTESGADNIFSFLDVVPESVDWIEFKVVSSADSVGDTANTQRSLQLWARNSGSSQAIGNDNVVTRLVLSTDDTGLGYVSSVSHVKTQIVNGVFELYWSSTFTTATSIQMFITGYGYNE